MNIELQTREFHSADALLAHYRALKARRKFGPDLVRARNAAPAPIEPPKPRLTRGIWDTRTIYGAPIGPRLPISAAQEMAVIEADVPLTNIQKARRVLAEICEEFGVSINDLRSARRSVDVVQPRKKAYWRLKSETTWSLPQIGRFMGGKDHTSVLHGIRRFQFEALCSKTGVLPTDKNFKAWVAGGCK